MRKGFIFKLVVIAIMFYLPLQSMAWGVIGHRVVGQIAESYLSPTARARVKAILGNESVAMASTWADFIKSDTNFRYLDPWHYINVESGLTPTQLYDQLKADTVVNAYTQINFLVKELKNKDLSQEKQLFYLRMLIHLVGDIHQPFHVGHKEDRGGNDVKVTWFNEPSNIHRVWDEQIVKFQELSYTEYAKAINHTTKTQRSEWQSQPMLEWLNESYQISQRLYQEIKQPNQKLSYQYNFYHNHTLNEQLLKGGVRLAGILNEIFK